MKRNRSVVCVMKRMKVIFLFLALILPICIFVFLKMFGKNEFHVEPLFVDSAPVANECGNVNAPYVLDDSIKLQLPFRSDSLLVITFDGNTDQNATNQLNRLKDEISGLPVGLLTLPTNERHLRWKRCVFFLKDPQDIVMVDAKGQLRGQYTSSDREDIDRLFTEVTIILKRY